MAWKSFAFIFLVLFSGVSQAQLSCESVLSSFYSASLRVDPQQAVEQMMLWEQQANTERWKKPTEVGLMEVASASATDVAIRQLDGIGSIQSMIFASGQVRWPKHPFNFDETVPYFASPMITQWKIRFSASRSVFLYSPQGELYSIKTPTNNPHNSKTLAQAKSDLSKSVVISLRRSKMVEWLKRQAQSVDEHFEFLLDVLSVTDRKTGNGFVVRDLRPLQDGHYYLPAFSIPYVGREIAKSLGQDFERLWGREWAAMLGRAKASLLINYGLQMKTPNAQNILIQLDRHFRPTGKIFFRDISDSSLVGPVAEGLGLRAQLQDEIESGFHVSQELVPYWENSSWQMDEGGVKASTLKQWGQRHDRAYLDLIIDALSKTPAGKDLFQNVFSVPALQKVLFSGAGQQALAQYRQIGRQENSFTYEENDGRLKLLEPSLMQQLKEKFLGSVPSVGPSIEALRHKFGVSP